MAKKLAHELAVGDRVRMEDNKVRVVARVGPGFLRYAKGAGVTTVGSIFIDWRDGDWSQVARDDVCEMAD